MLKLQKHIALLTLYVLVMGFQITGSYGALHAASSNIELASSDTILSTVYYTAEAKVHDTRSVELLAEMAEFEKEEEDTAVETDASRAVTHAYYTSFLRFTLLDLYHSEKRFDALEIRTSIHLYLQFQVFRL